MQLIQPKVRELQKKYGHDRERLAQETMKLYKDSGTNPFASCLPIILQMPIFLALFRLIDQAAKNPQDPKGLMTVTLNEQFGDAVVPRCQDLRHVPQHRRHRRAGAGGRPRARHDGDHVPHPAPADEQEHAGRRALRPLRPAAEDAALRPPGRVRRRWYRVPDRCPLLLDHVEPLDHGPAVLRHPQQPGSRHARGRRPRRTATGRRPLARGRRRPRRSRRSASPPRPRPAARRSPRPASSPSGSPSPSAARRSADPDLP